MSGARLPPPLPDPGDRGIPRYCEEPLPPYRYVPGRHRRPGRQGVVVPEGRRTGGDTPAGTVERAWCRGVDLFNAWYFWEAHEAWEEVWRRAAAGSPEQRLAKGMIQIAAALLKVHLGRRDAARRLAHSGVAQLRAAAAQSAEVLGTRPAALGAAFEGCFAALLGGDPSGGLHAGVPALRLEREPAALTAGVAPGSRRC